MNYKLRIKKRNAGYTIIETMIAISLFLIIVTIGMGSLLNANFVHRKSQDMRSIMDNLSFTMEDMSRNLRTGYNYHCDDGSGDISIPLDCNNGGLIAFESSVGDQTTTVDQWVYKIESPLGDGVFNIYKSTAGGEVGTFVQLNPPEVKIDGFSSFTVTGAETYPGDTRQPFVTIRLSGTVTSRNNETPIPFSLQTSISQRLIDIEAPSNIIPIVPPVVPPALPVSNLNQSKKMQ